MRSFPHFAMRRLLSLATALSAFGLASPASAALLTPAHEAQLEAWLGQGNLDLTNIYTKATGDDSLDFHAAVDGKGATFTLISIYGNGGSNLVPVAPQLIGGYNPQSWNSSSGWNMAVNLPDRTAFIFNLTSGSVQFQSTNHSLGGFQTLNLPGYGPTFGAGHDIHVQGDLTAGYSNNYSYGNTISDSEIVSGSPNQILHPGNFAYVYSVAAIEVYTFAPAAPQGVPDTASSFLLIGASLLGLAALHRRR